MFWKNREKIRALEKEVEELRADNEKIHRILKHVGKEPCVEIGIDYHYEMEEDSNKRYVYYAGRYLDKKYAYTLYFYHQGEEYVVELQEFKGSKYIFKSHEIKSIDWPIVNIILNFKVLRINSSFGVNGWWYDDERYLIQFNCITGEYRRTYITDDLVRVIKDDICEECNKEEKEKTIKDNVIDELDMWCINCGHYEPHRDESGGLCTHLGYSKHDHDSCDCFYYRRRKNET